MTVHMCSCSKATAICLIWKTRDSLCVSCIGVDAVGAFMYRCHRHSVYPNLSATEFYRELPPEPTLLCMQQSQKLKRSSGDQSSTDDWWGWCVSTLDSLPRGLIYFLSSQELLVLTFASETIPNCVGPQQVL